MNKTDFFFMGMFTGALIMYVVFCFLSFTDVQHTYDGRPYIKHGGRYYMLISDEPMNIKTVTVVESREK
jgi:hypothetical protein